MHSVRQQLVCCDETFSKMKTQANERRAMGRRWRLTTTAIWSLRSKNRQPGLTFSSKGSFNVLLTNTNAARVITVANQSADYHVVMRNVTMTEEENHLRPVMGGSLYFTSGQHSVQLCSEQPAGLLQLRFPVSLSVFILCVCTCASIRVVTHRYGATARHTRPR